MYLFLPRRVEEPATKTNALLQAYALQYNFTRWVKLMPKIEIEAIADCDCAALDGFSIAVDEAPAHATGLDIFPGHWVESSNGAERKTVQVRPSVLVSSVVS
jgi:hypothetical protein